jgi:hypothetical protein
MRDYGKKGKTAHYSEGGKVMRTEEMSSGAQQWVREHPTRGKLGTITETNESDYRQKDAARDYKGRRKNREMLGRAYSDELSEIGKRRTRP